MRILSFLSMTMILLIACNESPQNNTDKHPENQVVQIEFDSEKWKTQKEEHYPFREAMYKNILDDMELRKLSEAEVLEQFGTPNRRNEGYFYYTISQSRMGNWPLHTKSLVIKLMDQEDKVEWIKLHK